MCCKMYTGLHLAASSTIYISTCLMSRDSDTYKFVGIAPHSNSEYKMRQPTLMCDLSFQRLQMRQKTLLGREWLPAQLAAHNLTQTYSLYGAVHTTNSCPVSEEICNAFQMLHDSVYVAPTSTLIPVNLRTPASCPTLTD